MKTLDFLFFYFVRLFEVTDRRAVKTISYTDQAEYALSICSTLWLILANGVLEYILFDTFKSKIPKFVFIFIGMGLYFLYRQIYIKNKRYILILKKTDQEFNVSDKAGRIIVVIVFFSSMLILMLTTIILHRLN